MWGQVMHTSEWVGGGTDQAKVTRGVHASDNSRCSTATVEFTGSNWKIQREEHAYVANDTDEVETIATALGSIAKACIHPQIRTTSSSGAPEAHFQRVWISSNAVHQPHQERRNQRGQRRLDHREYPVRWHD